jgi:hypothetical protein
MQEKREKTACVVYGNNRQAKVVCLLLEELGIEHYALDDGATADTAMFAFFISEKVFAKSCRLTRDRNRVARVLKTHSFNERNFDEFIPTCASRAAGFVALRKLASEFYNSKEGQVRIKSALRESYILCEKNLRLKLACENGALKRREAAAKENSQAQEQAAP